MIDYINMLIYVMCIDREDVSNILFADRRNCYVVMLLAY